MNYLSRSKFAAPIYFFRLNRAVSRNELIQIADGVFACVEGFWGAFLCRMGIVISKAPLVDAAGSPLGIDKINEIIGEGGMLIVLTPGDFCIEFPKQSGCVRYIKTKSTAIVSINDGYNCWLQKIRKKHRYYVRKAFSDNCIEYSVEQNLSDFNLEHYVARYYKFSKDRNFLPYESDAGNFFESLTAFRKNIVVIRASICGNECFFMMVFVDEISSRATLMVSVLDSYRTHDNLVGYGAIAYTVQYLESKKIMLFDLGGLAMGSNIASFKLGFSTKLLTIPRYIVGSKFFRSSK